MQKKYKSLLYIFVLAIMLISPIFAGCNETPKLSTLSFVNVEVNEDIHGDQRQLLVTENNINATGYEFGISIQNQDIEQFLVFPTQNCYLDVTNIFKNAQTYYFYAKAIGNEDFLDSDISEIYSYTLQYKLATPTIELNGTSLSWSSVENAKIYSIFANNQLIADVEGNNYDISAYIQSHAQDTPYNFKVACKANGNYLRSADSATVTYTDHLKLSVPANLRIVASSENKTLVWDAVYKCTKYLVVINNNIEIEVENANSLDITEYYTSLGEYSFKVKSVASGNYSGSDFCETIFDTYTQKLDTPQNLTCFINDNNIEVSWSSVENAQEYLIFVNDTQFIVNDGTGVYAPITTNSVILSFSSLNITSAEELDFIYIQIQAKGYGYYTNSNKSVSTPIKDVSRVLAAPVVNVLEDENKVYWNKINRAVGYELEINNNNYTTKITEGFVEENNNIYYDISNLNCGSYIFKVKALSLSEELNSTVSNVVIAELYEQLSTPVINDVEIENDNFKLEFSLDSNANTYSLYVNDQLYSNNLTNSNIYIAINDLKNLAEADDDYNFYIQLNSNGYYTQSDSSNKFIINKQLQSPENLNINNKILSWNSVKYAKKYIVALDDKLYTTTTNQLNLSGIVPENKTRQIKVYAERDGFNNSNYSSTIYFNNINKYIEGITDKYFYYGETYDYYITSEEELIIVFENMVKNFIESTQLYIDYDASTSSYTKLSAVRNKINVGTRKYKLKKQGLSDGQYMNYLDSVYIGKLDLCFLFYGITEPPTYTTSTTTFEYVNVYKTSNPRSNNYNNFVTENAIVSQDVYTTDGLVSAAENRAKPIIKGSNAVTVNLVYEKAKQILREICDDNMTDYQKALAIHDYLVDNISYDNYGLNNVNTTNSIGIFHYIESALLYNLAVCDGYAKSFSLLCNMEGIETIVIAGKVDGGGHAWNKVYIDYNNDGTKEWLTVDCTFDDIYTATYGEILSHDHFMIPDSFYSNRTENIKYPVSTEQNATYYKTQIVNGTNLIINSVAQFKLIVNYLKSNLDCKGLEVLIQIDIRNMCSDSAVTSFTYAYNTDYLRRYIYLV